jgi:uncharacterized protein with GYD domain
MCGQIASRTNVLRVKAMTENPQDRSAQAAKLAESFGGKMEAAYWPGWQRATLPRPNPFR